MLHDADAACVQRALLRTAQEVAKGMDYIHSCGIIHGDLKARVRLLAYQALILHACAACTLDIGQTAAGPETVSLMQRHAVPCRAVVTIAYLQNSKSTSGHTIWEAHSWCSHSWSHSWVSRSRQNTPCCLVTHCADGDCTQAGNVLLKTHRIDRRGYIAKVADFGEPLLHRSLCLPSP